MQLMLMLLLLLAIGGKQRLKGLWMVLKDLNEISKAVIRLLLLLTIGGKLRRKGYTDIAKTLKFKGQSCDENCLLILKI